MQNWRIKRMSVKRINQWLSAIGKLLRHYEGKVRINYCPFCDVLPGWGCSPCPWEVIEGISCEGFARKLYGHTGANRYRSDLRFKRWRIIRIGQLRNWKKIFKLELARRFE